SARGVGGSLFAVSEKVPPDFGVALREATGQAARLRLGSDRAAYTTLAMRVNFASICDFKLNTIPPISVRDPTHESKRAPASLAPHDRRADRLRKASRARAFLN